MPYSIRKVSGGYKVVNTQTGDVKAAKTSLENAERQRRLLQGVEHGFKPTGAGPRRPVTSELIRKISERLKRR